MPTNANTFNSRVTSEALEAKYRSVFPAQGGAELVQDLYASGVIQPVIDFSAVAEGSALRADLQQAWDFSTGHTQVQNTTSNLITNTGFWKVSASVGYTTGTVTPEARLQITDGVGTKIIFAVEVVNSGVAVESELLGQWEGVVFLRSGDTFQGYSSQTNVILDVQYRQIADVYGNLTNPLGYTTS